MIGLIFNLGVSLLLAGYLFRSVRRFELRADSILEQMDRSFETELKKYDEAREIIRASKQGNLNTLIATLNRQPDHELPVAETHHRNRNTNGSTESHHAERSI